MRTFRWGVALGGAALLSAVAACFGDEPIPTHIITVNSSGGPQEAGASSSSGATDASASGGSSSSSGGSGTSSGGFSSASSSSTSSSSGDVFDASDAALEDASSPACGAYCYTVMLGCTGGLAVYENDQQCWAACAAWPSGTTGATTGNTIACHQHYADGTNGDPGLNCAPAGPNSTQCVGP